MIYTVKVKIIEFNAGSFIREAILIAIEMVKKENVAIAFSFNGVPFYMAPNTLFPLEFYLNTYDLILKAKNILGDR